MVLSEAEAEAQLARLRRERETLDRAIADLTLYLELGRRLRSGPNRPVEPIAPGSGEPQAFRDRTVARDREVPEVRSAGSGDPDTSVSAPAMRRDPASVEAETRPDDATVAKERAGSESGETSDASEGVLSEGVLARRHGRALIEAAIAALDEAGRPLHAGEIMAVLTSRGLSLPGHDPVAALNTRLWKRSGPGGPFRRMGDAVYALAEPGQDAPGKPAGSGR